MEHPLLETVPAERRDVVRDALAALFGNSQLAGLQPVTGGASGAAIFRTEVAGRSYLLRIEGPRSHFRNPHQYACMRTAADAGIAPPIRHLDADAGVVIMDFIPSRALAGYPGGSANLVRDLGALAARLQQTPKFPQLRDYPLVVERLLGLARGGLFVPGLLDAHTEAFQRIKEAYPWDTAMSVSSHNDPNPRNILFDGNRLWLIDWETAYGNDPWVDVAIVADNFAAAPELADALLQAWLGAAPDPVAHARLLLMRLLTRLYYAGLILGICASRGPRVAETDLSAPTEAEFRSALSGGELALGAPDTMLLLGKMQLARFLAGVSDPAFDRALATVAGR